MKKNCSKCKGFHEPPFGKYCHYIVKSCGVCGTEHKGDSALCVSAEHSKMSKDGKPVSGDFPSREDPKYLQFLEQEFLRARESKVQGLDMESLVQRIDALEKRPVTQIHAAPVGLQGSPSHLQAGAGLGQYAGTGGRPKYTPSVVGHSRGEGTNPLGLGAGGVLGAGGGGALGGGGDHEDPPAPSPAEAMVAPLTDVLEKLTIAVDPASSSRKLQGMVFKPEFHVQHIKKGVSLKHVDHTKLTYREMVYGWFCILQHLIKVEGDVDSYIGHCRYVSQQAMASQFSDGAYVGYDRHVVEQLIDGDSDTFVVGDNLGVATHFHAGNLSSQKTPLKLKQGKKWGKRTSDKSDKAGDDSLKSNMPEGFPDDICYAYNFKKCTGSCSKKHVCRSCGGRHRAIGCEEKI